MDRFGRARFAAAAPDERTAICTELAAYLSGRLRGRDFHKEVYGLVAELKSAGHDLWSQDESDEFQIWGPNYQVPQPGLVITFAIPDRVKVEFVQA